MYSGRVAAHVFAKLPRADTFVIIGPNHSGVGSAVAVSKERWSTPLGEIESDTNFIDKLPKKIIDVDEIAHRHEHSVEVQLPFLQYLFGSFKIVSICMGLQDEDTAKDVAIELTGAMDAIDEKVIILASSDFTHYQPDEIARKNDHYVIEPILDLDVSGFYMRKNERNATVCGYGPIAAMIQAVKKDAEKAELVKYATSGDVTGDKSSVVGYAGIIVI
jgi:hypothetical protein